MDGGERVFSARTIPLLQATRIVLKASDAVTNAWRVQPLPSSVLILRSLERFASRSSAAGGRVAWWGIGDAARPPTPFASAQSLPAAAHFRSLDAACPAVPDPVAQGLAATPAPVL